MRGCSHRERNLSDQHTQPATRRSFTREETAGLAFGITGFTIWGLTPLYFKALGALPAAEIVSHRFIWSMVFMMLVLTVSRQWPAVAHAMTRPRVLAVLLVTGVLIGTNWLVFIHAVLVDRIVAASLGYFLNPLVSVLLGFVFLRERLTPLQWSAVGLAACGVLTQVIAYGALPWIALVLGLTFATYGLLRKKVDAGAAVGLFLETALLLPAVLGVLIWLELAGAGAFTNRGIGFDLLLAFAGIATGLPLVLYAAGARRVKLSTMGLLQYIAPSGNLLIAVMLFGEPFTRVEAITFAFIWSALAVYTVEIWRTRIV